MARVCLRVPEVCTAAGAQGDMRSVGLQVVQLLRPVIFGCTGEYTEDRTLYKYVTTDLMGDIIPTIVTERRPLTPFSATS